MAAAADSPNVAVVGVGLIGGSIGLAARERARAGVRGYDPDPAVIAAALDHGALDSSAGSIAEAVAGADVAFVAAPVGELRGAIAEVLDAAGPACAVTDVGSTKREVVSSLSDPRFIGGHPLAGAETAGVANARADLFDGATWYLTPAQHASGVLYERLHRLLVAFGARPTALDAELHDRLMATVSHLPHVLANVLVSQAAGAIDAGEPMPATGPSFRDATRVAGANSAIWTDIYISNRDALVTEIDATLERLRTVRDALAVADSGAIEQWNEAAREHREALLGAGLAGGPVHELRAAVPNRPGVIAQIALALGRAGVNIADMTLAPSPDGSQGVVALWVQGDADARRAQELISSLEIPVARA